MDVIYLYSRVMPYTVYCLKALIKQTGVKVHLVHYPVSDNAPYQLPEVTGISYYNKEQLSSEELEGLMQLNPRFVFVTGWADKTYLQMALKCKRRGIPVISGCDTQWRGDIRQWVAVTLSKWLIRKYFDFLMVAGSYQYEYGRLLGFRRDQILKPLYVADHELYSVNFEKTFQRKQQIYPKNILFVGRFEQVKGIDLLIRAFLKVTERNGWSLTLIGNGSMRAELMRVYGSNAEISFKEFMQPGQLIHEVANAGIFCLPSIYEPWGVVIQEFTAAGLPIVVSDACGAAEALVKHAFNGYVFKSGDEEDLSRGLSKMMALDNSELLQYAKRSNSLAHSLLPEMYVSNFSQFLI